jgi:hypothetical protein
VRSLLTGVKTEMPLGFSVSGSSEKEDVLAGGGELSQLIEGVAGSLGSGNSASGGGGELEGDNLKSFGDIEESDVVGDGSDDGDEAVELAGSFSEGGSVLGEESGDAGDGDGVAIKSGLVESLVDDLIELGVGSSGEEGVKLRGVGRTLMRLLR